MKTGEAVLYLLKNSFGKSWGLRFLQVLKHAEVCFGDGRIYD